MKLFDNAFSPFARKVRLVLQHKGLPFEVVDGLDLGNRELLEAQNPRAEVPALAQIYSLVKPGGFFISSTVCLGGAKRLLFGPLLGLMRLVGKAPPVVMFTAATLLEDIRAAGFPDAALVDVGAKGGIAFIVARKPAAR